MNVLCTNESGGKGNLLILFLSPVCFFFFICNHIIRSLFCFLRMKCFPSSMHLKHIFHMSRAGRVSFGIIVPYLIWVTHRQVYSNRLTSQAPFASEKCLLLHSGSVDLLGSSEQFFTLDAGREVCKFGVLLIFTDSHSTSLVMMWFLHLFSISRVVCLQASLLVGAVVQRAPYLPPFFLSEAQPPGGAREG